MGAKTNLLPLTSCNLAVDFSRRISKKKITGYGPICELFSRLAINNEELLIGVMLPSFANNFPSCGKLHGGQVQVLYHARSRASDMPTNTHCHFTVIKRWCLYITFYFVRRTGKTLK